MEELRRLGLEERVRGILCDWYRTKPESTYNDLVGQHGERLVEGYSWVGHHQIDLVEDYTLP